MPVQLSYDAVIATRNRPEALALSIPLLIHQSRPPTQLIVIDSSENHGAVRDTVQSVTSGWSGTVIVEPSPPGLPVQRNKGLSHVTAPVVFFPDDDSLYCAGAAAEIMAIYERDVEQRVAGVAAMERIEPPEILDCKTSWTVMRGHRREAKTRWLRNALERHISVLKPAIFLGTTLNQRHSVPDWLVHSDAAPVAYMTGFRMTFRTEAIVSQGFDEALSGYAVDEDIDASLTAMQNGLVVGTRRAGVYHHRARSGRAEPRSLARMQIENRAHVLQKHAAGPLGSPRLAGRLRRRHAVFSALKLFSALAKSYNASGRAALLGTLEGYYRSHVVWSRV